MAASLCGLTFGPVLRIDEPGPDRPVCVLCVNVASRLIEDARGDARKQLAAQELSDHIRRLSAESLAG